MQRIKDLKLKLIFTTGYLALVVLLMYFNIPCLFQHFLYIPCPGCGITRALISALQFDFTEAFRFNPMFWSVPVLYLYFIFDGKLFGRKLIDITVLVFIAVGFLVSWIIKLCTYLS